VFAPFPLPHSFDPFLSWFLDFLGLFVYFILFFFLFMIFIFCLLLLFFFGLNYSRINPVSLNRVLIDPQVCVGNDHSLHFITITIRISFHIASPDSR
jgi:hypothetical protein